MTTVVYKFRYQIHFPMDCPPIGAVEANHTVHRFCKSSAPAPRDFVPYVISHPRDYTPEELVKACGVSVYTNEVDLKKLADFHHGLRKKTILKAKLLPDHGKILATPFENDSHHTWWEYEDVRPELLFGV